MSELAEPLKNHVVVFSLDEQHYAMPLQAVESVVRMVEITEVPGFPRYIQGVVNVHGTIMAVINLRRRMHLMERQEALEDKLIITRCQNRAYALMVDGVSGVLGLEYREQDEEVLESSGLLTGIVKMPDGMILLQNPDALLTVGDREQIDAILGQVKL